ncbi:hypothetical protein [Nostoc sp. FACHB-280]|uniref:hypothetical protein n=1 Tax=Nostoc sp. FACHB-280 TaxID=2692839 RepID=UPI001F54C137|nr:hypothetical protein [Nostoc sp. FACHB-280]
MGYRIKNDVSIKLVFASERDERCPKAIFGSLKYSVDAKNSKGKQMADDSRFDNIYLRLNELTEGVANLKIQAGTIGTSQVAIARTLSLAMGLASDMREVKADICDIKANIHNLNTGVKEVLRLLNSSSLKPEFQH